MSTCSQAQHFVEQIKNVGTLNEEGDVLTMCYLLDMLCCAGEDWHYNQDDSFNVIFKDKSCLRVLEDSFHIIDDFHQEFK